MDLLPNLKKVFNAKQMFRKAVLSTIAMRRFSNHGLPAGLSKLADEVSQYKHDAEQENIDEERHVYAHQSHDNEDPLTPRTPNPQAGDQTLSSQMERTSLN